jgi:hypothetical protein
LPRFSSYIYAASNRLLSPASTTPAAGQGSTSAHETQPLLRSTLKSARPPSCFAPLGEHQSLHWPLHGRRAAGHHITIYATEASTRVDMVLCGQWCKDERLGAVESITLCFVVYPPHVHIPLCLVLTPTLIAGTQYGTVRLPNVHAFLMYAELLIKLLMFYQICFLMFKDLCMHNVYNHSKSISIKF